MQERPDITQRFEDSSRYMRPVFLFAICGVDHFDQIPRIAKQKRQQSTQHKIDFRILPSVPYINIKVSPGATDTPSPFVQYLKEEKDSSPENVSRTDSSNLENFTRKGKGLIASETILPENT